MGTWDEGPEPPARLREMVLLFAEAHPRATRREWADFAARHAGECYRTGYARGFEASVRDDDQKPWLADMPERVADQVDPGWRENRLPRGGEVAEDIDAAYEEG